jgi:hypothetical protein
MVAGGLYIWLILGCFGLVAGIMVVLAVALYVGYVLQKRRTGESTGFLEYSPPATPVPPEKKV